MQPCITPTPDALHPGHSPSRCEGNLSIFHTRICANAPSAILPCASGHTVSYAPRRPSAEPYWQCRRMTEMNTCFQHSKAQPEQKLTHRSMEYSVALHRAHVGLLRTRSRVGSDLTHLINALPACARITHSAAACMTTRQSDHVRIEPNPNLGSSANT